MVKVNVLISCMWYLVIVNALEDHNAQWAKCEVDGFWAHPRNCNWFVACLDGDISTGRCEEWEYFDSELKHCVEKDQFDCQIVPGPECPDSFGISFIPSSESCEEYYLCVNGDPHTMNCRAGLHWNQDKVACDYPQSANCLVESKPDLPDCHHGFPYIKPHPWNCNWFVKCSSNGIRSIQGCPHLHHFDIFQNKCIFMRNAVCFSD